MVRLALSSALGVAAIAMPLLTATAQQSGVSLNPFVAFPSVGSAHPMAGLSLALTGGPVALRAGGHMSMEERGASSLGSIVTKPWIADADALAFLESYNYGEHVSFTPYVFVGVSTSAVDSGALRVNRQGWSYGGGWTMPMGSAFGAFGEARWRMTQFVMPSSSNAPTATREFRLGLSFHVGSGGSATEVVHVLSSLDVSPEGDNSSSLGRTVSRLLETADKYVGTPFKRGGMSPSSGFDAAGFVRFVFSMLGVNLPRNARDQARVGQQLRADWSGLAPGDLVMFQDAGGINHVAIYVGRSRIIHSSETGGGVRYDDLSSERGKWFMQHLAAVRRVTPDMRGVLLDLARGLPSDDSRWDEPDHAPRAPMRKR